MRLFSEARQRMPSVIFIPNLNAWYRTLDKSAISTFLSLLRTLAPTDPVLVLGVLEDDGQEVNKRIVKTLFGYSAKNQFELTRPDEVKYLLVSSTCPCTTDPSAAGSKSVLWKCCRLYQKSARRLSRPKTAETAKDRTPRRGASTSSTTPTDKGGAASPGEERQTSSQLAEDQNPSCDGADQ